MKEMTTRLFILTTLIFLFVNPVVSQNGKRSKYSSSEDSIHCGKYLSAYRQFFLINVYEHALESWWIVFHDCPASSEKMYVHGATMYRSYIEAAPEGPAREGLIDTLMMIYDQRIAYFGGEGNVLGRKGKDLLTYRGTDIEQVHHAYEMLRKSVKLQGEESREQVMLLLISAGISLNKEDKIDSNQVIEDYLMVSGILDQKKGSSTRRERTRSAINEMMLKENMLSCEALNHYYEPQFEQYSKDKAYQEKLINLYSAAGCNHSDICVAASENLYSMEPGPESAHHLAMLFITRNDYEKAAGYLEQALEGENIDILIRAEWYYELAVVSSARKEHCKAIEYAREAINLKSDYGKAYIQLGDAFIASRTNLGDEFQQRTAFWAAADMYKKAGLVDPSVTEEANRKLNAYTVQFPDHEEIFFHDLKDGDTYLVGGCINEHTTVRSGR